MKTERIFCVHSKKRPLHDQLYGELAKRTDDIEAILTSYDEWSWSTQEGRSDKDLQREAEQDFYDYQKGYRNLRGFGRVKNPPLELELTLTKTKPEPQYDLNVPDLKRLIQEAKCIVLFEDEEQDELSEGMMSEWPILTNHQGGRLLNTRIFKEGENAYKDSIFPFSDSLKPNYVMAIRYSDENRLRAADVETLLFVLALNLDDTPGRDNLVPHQGPPIYKVDFKRNPVPIAPRGQYLYKACLKLAVSDDDHQRRLALTSIVLVRDPELRQRMCQHLCRVFITKEFADRHLEDYGRFMQLMPDFDWEETIYRINSR